MDISLTLISGLMAFLLSFLLTVYCYKCGYLSKYKNKVFLGIFFVSVFWFISIPLLFAAFVSRSIAKIVFKTKNK